jgi:hypothetical protein
VIFAVEEGKAVPVVPRAVSRRVEAETKRVSGWRSLMMIRGDASAMPWFLWGFIGGIMRSG